MYENNISITNNKLNCKDISIQVNIDNGWTDYKIKQLKRKAIELKIYQYIHRDAGTYYKKLHQKLFLPQTSIMTIASGTLFISLSDKISATGRYWINLFVSFLTLIGSVLSVWVKFFNAEQLSYDHLKASKKYAIIVDDIEEQLGLENDEKESFQDYMNKIKNLINEQKKLSLDIDKKFWDNYFKSVSRGDLIMLNETVLDEQITREMDRIENTNGQRSYISLDIKHFDNNFHSNNGNHGNHSNYDNNDNHNSDNSNDNNIKNEIVQKNLSTYNTEDLKRKLMYQLQRNL
jgi:hypothetical protein